MQHRTRKLPLTAVVFGHANAGVRTVIESLVDHCLEGPSAQCGSAHATIPFDQQVKDLQVNEDGRHLGVGTNAGNNSKNSNSSDNYQDDNDCNNQNSNEMHGCFESRRFRVSLYHWSSHSNSDDSNSMDNIKGLLLATKTLAPPDLGILIVSAVPEEFEVGMGTGSIDRQNGLKTPAATTTAKMTTTSEPIISATTTTTTTTTTPATTPATATSTAAAMTTVTEMKRVKRYNIDHLQLHLARYLGIRQWVVLINKMDIVNWSEHHYFEIKEQVMKVFLRAGYSFDNGSIIPVVPICATLGYNLGGVCSQNITERMQWYQGWDHDSGSNDSILPPPPPLSLHPKKTFLDALDYTTTLPTRVVDSPLRLSVYGKFKIGGIGTVIWGKIHSGILQSGTVIKILPVNIATEVKSIEINNEHVDQGFVKEMVAFNVMNVSRHLIQRGQVVSCWKSNVAGIRVESFIALVMVKNCRILKKKQRIRVGYIPLMECHQARIPCRLDRILNRFKKGPVRSKTISSTAVSIAAATVEAASNMKIDEVKLDTTAGTNMNGNNDNEWLNVGELAVVRMVPQMPVCLDLFRLFPHFGRFQLIDNQCVVVEGIVMSVKELERSKKKEVSRQVRR